MRPQRQDRMSETRKQTGYSSVIHRKMPNSYSVDFHWRVVWFGITYQLSVQETAQRMCISERTVRRYVVMFQQTGEIKPDT